MSHPDPLGRTRPCTSTKQNSQCEGPRAAPGRHPGLVLIDRPLVAEAGARQDLLLRERARQPSPKARSSRAPPQSGSAFGGLGGTSAGAGHVAGRGAIRGVALWCRGAPAGSRWPRTRPRPGTLYLQGPDARSRGCLPWCQRHQRAGGAGAPGGEAVKRVVEVATARPDIGPSRCPILRTCVLTEQRREFLQFRGRAGSCAVTVASHGPTGGAGH